MASLMALLFFAYIGGLWSRDEGTREFASIGVGLTALLVIFLVATRRKWSACLKAILKKIRVRPTTQGQTGSGSEPTRAGRMRYKIGSQPSPKKGKNHCLNMDLG